MPMFFVQVFRSRGPLININLFISSEKSKHTRICEVNDSNVIEPDTLLVKSLPIFAG